MPVSRASCARSVRSRAPSAAARSTSWARTCATRRRRRTCWSACRRCGATTWRTRSASVSARGKRTEAPASGSGPPPEAPGTPVRYLGVSAAWLKKWGVSLASLVGGVLTLFVFQRGLPHVSLIIGYVLLLWLLVAVLVQTREALQSSGKKTLRFVLTATDYTIQTLYHGVLLFLIPAYYAAATLTSVNAFFVALLVALALVATFDPLYQAIVHPRPWVSAIFFIVSLFGALNLALPLVRVPPIFALVLSAWMAT